METGYTLGYSNINRNRGDTLEAANSSARLPRGGLPFILQYNYWETHTQQMEGDHIYLLPEGEIPNR